MSSLDMESGETLVSTSSTIGTVRTSRLEISSGAEHFPPLKLHHNRDSVSTTYTLATETGIRARGTSSSFLFPLPPPLRLPVPGKEAVKKCLEEAESGRDDADSESPGSFKTARVSWSDWIEGQKRFSREIEQVHGMSLWPSRDCAFSRSNPLEECIEEDGLSIAPKSIENTVNGNVAELDSKTEQQTTTSPEERYLSISPRGGVPNGDQTYATTLRSSPVSSLGGLHSRRCSHRRNRSIRLNTSPLFLTKSAPPSPTFPPGRIELLPLRRAATTLSTHRGSHSLSSSADFGPRTLSVRSTYRQHFVPDFDFIPRTRSVPLERRPSASSLNFSYPSRYPIFPELQRHRSNPTTHSGKILPIWQGAGMDGPIDTPMASLTPIERSKSCNTADYSAAAFKKLHGGVAPVIDFNEFRANGHSRPPLTSRTSSQYSRIQFHTPSYSLTALDDQKKTPLSRRASYSSVTGISPISSVPISEKVDPLQSLERGSFSRLKPPRLSLETMTHLDGNLTTPDNGRSSGSAPGSPVRAIIPEANLFQFQTVERKRVNDFDFINTLETAARPYTPDKFILEAAMANNGTLTTRNPSKRSARSFGALSKRSAGSTYASVGSITRTRNVLRKTNPRLSKEGRESVEERDDDDFTPEPIEFEFSNENKGVFNSMLSIGRHPTKEEFSTDIPHTATTCAGPARGIIQGENGFPLDYKQLSGRSETALSPRDKLSNFAKESKAKYDTLSQGLKHKLVSRRTVKPKFRWPITPEEAVLESPIIVDPVPSEANIARQSETMQQDNTTGSNSPTTASASGESRHYILSTVYSESQQALRRLYNRNWGNTYVEYREQRQAYGYRTAQAKVKMYMSGARSESLTALEGFGRKIGMGSKLGEWQRAGNRWNKSRKCRDKTDVMAEKLSQIHQEQEVRDENIPTLHTEEIPAAQRETAQEKHEKIVTQAQYDGQDSPRTSSKDSKDRKLMWIKAYWSAAKTGLTGMRLTKRT